MARSGNVREGVPTREIRIRVVETHAYQGYASAEWRRRNRIVEQLHIEKVVGDSCASPNRGLAITEWIPSKTNARLKVLPYRSDGRLSVKTRIARVEKPRRRIRINCAFKALLIAGHIEGVALFVLGLNGEKRLPTDTIV